MKKVYFKDVLDVLDNQGITVSMIARHFSISIQNARSVLNRMARERLLIKRLRKTDGLRREYYYFAN